MAATQNAWPRNRGHLRELSQARVVVRRFPHWL